MKNDISGNVSNVGVNEKVVNIYQSEYDVYIGRAGKGRDGYFGNPHPIGYCEICFETHNRAGSITAYSLDFQMRLIEDAEFLRRVHELKGLVLGCFCKPKDCHGDIIVDYLESLNEGESDDSPSANKVIGIIGSRRRDSVEDYELCLSVLRTIGVSPGDSIVSGGCPQGGDRFAEVIACKYNIPITIHEALWKKHGRGAGLLRNTDIARDADILVAVVAADRKGGTEDTIRKFAKMGKTKLILVPQTVIDNPKERFTIHTITKDVCTFCEEDGRDLRFIHLNKSSGKKSCPHCAFDFHSRPATEEEVTKFYKPFVDRYETGMKNFLADMVRIWGSLDNVPEDEGSMELVCNVCNHTEQGDYVIGSGIIRCPNCKEKDITIVDQFGASFDQDPMPWNHPKAEASQVEVV